MAELGTLSEMVGSLERCVGEFEPAVFDAAGAAEMVELFGRVERLGGAGKALAARRVDECGTWKGEGFRSGAHWLAARSGETIGEAERALRTARALDDLPSTDAAFRRGELSSVQASEITETALAAPAMESELLATATESSVKVLRDECRRVRVESVADDAAWAAGLQARRRLDRWKDPDGMGRGDYKLPPAECARLNAAIDSEADRLFREAWREGRREPRAAYAADALVNLVAGGPRKPPEVKLTADGSAINRGWVESGERCEIDGFGPVPVTVARVMLQDASVSILVREGDERISVATRSRRTISRELRRRLELRDPVCANSACGADGPFEIDHIVPVAEHGPTNEANCWLLCRHCHRLKTYFGWQVETDDRGRRRLVPPRGGGP